MADASRQTIQAGIREEIPRRKKQPSCDQMMPGQAERAVAIYVCPLLATICYWISRGWQAPYSSIGISLAVLVVFVGIALFAHQQLPERKGWIVGGLVLIAVIDVTLTVLNLRHTWEHPYTIKPISKIIVGDRPLRSAYSMVYSSLYGLTVSPIHFLLDLSLTNRQSEPTTIDSYILECEQSKGKWVQVATVPIDMGKMYWTHESLSDAIELDFTGRSLSDKLHSKELAPHETIDGWTLYETPPGGCGFYRALRLTIEDPDGTVAIAIPDMKPPTNSKAVAAPNPPEFAVTGHKADLSKAYPIYWSECCHR